eukprot:SAG22_NODE_1799_length_3545_cov_4.103018_2_plen_395_part_00
MGALDKEGNTLAKNPAAYDRTMDNLDRQLELAITQGEFTKAEELFATATGLQSSVARANEQIVGGKYMFEAGMLDEARYEEATTTAAYLNRVEQQVNAQVEARVHELERVHQKERAELEQLLQDKVRLEFTPTPEMLDLKAKVEHLLASSQFDRAEFTRQNLIKQERRDRKAYAESLWRSWGQRRNKLAYKQSLERARCESDIAARKAHFAVQKKAFFKVIDQKHKYHLQVLSNKYVNVNNDSRTSVRNKELRLPAVEARGSIPIGASENSPRHRPGDVAELPLPLGKVLFKSWVFQKQGRVSAVRQFWARALSLPPSLPFSLVHFPPPARLPTAFPRVVSLCLSAVPCGPTVLTVAVAAVAYDSSSSRRRRTPSCRPRPSGATRPGCWRRPAG